MASQPRCSVQDGVLDPASELYVRTYTDLTGADLAAARAGWHRILLLEHGSGMVCDVGPGASPTTRLTGGELALFPAGRRQAVVLERASGVFAEINADFLQKRAGVIDPLCKGFEPSRQASYADPVTRHLLVALGDKAGIRTQTQRALEEALIHRLIEHTVATPSPPAMVRGGLAPRQLRRIKELIEAELDENVSLVALAALVDLSPSHFSRAFKASTGCTPHQWRKGRRIERAKRLLAETPLSLVEIALACGFSSQSHFGNIFNAAVTMTPAAWRRLHRT